MCDVTGCMLVHAGAWNWPVTRRSRTEPRQDLGMTTGAFSHSRLDYWYAIRTVVHGLLPRANG